MHRRRCHKAGVDERLRTLFTLDQHDLFSAHQSGLVVQRARLGWCHPAPFGIPWPKFLLPPGWVVAIHHGNQIACRIVIIPLGGGRAQIIHRRLRLAPAWGRRMSAPQQIIALLQNLQKVSVIVDAEVTAYQAKDIAPVPGCTIRPQTCFIAIEHHFEAVPRAAQYIADEKFAAPLLASRK